VNQVKIFIYFVLLIGFLMFFQTEPVACIFILVIIAGGYILIKRKKGNSNGSFGFFGKNASPRGQSSDPLIMFLLINEILKDGHYSGTEKEKSIRTKDQRSSKEEVLKLFDE